MSKMLTLRANAKINLSLKVFERREDDYHDIDTDMQSISLHDIVTLKPTKGKIVIHCDHSDVPKDESNLAYKAAKLFFEEIKAKDEGVDITIKKNIDVAAGLGGGSADAAAVLYGLNLIHNSKLHKEKLHELAAKIGADVPFFLIGGTAKCTGIGDIMRKINPKTGNTYILVFPDIKVSARMVYDEFDKLNKKDRSLVNDLEQVVMAKFSIVKELKDKLVKATNLDWNMSGSGPVLFAEFRDLAEIDEHVEKVAALCKYHVAMRMNEGISVMEDAAS